MIRNGIHSTPAVFLSLVLASASVAAQQSKPSVPDQAPVAPERTLVATEQAAAVATSTDALPKATQNPVASRISVPVRWWRGQDYEAGISAGEPERHVLRQRCLSCRHVTLKRASTN
jgi:hypothetical protein